MTKITDIVTIELTKTPAAPKEPPWFVMEDVYTTILPYVLERRLRADGFNDAADFVATCAESFTCKECGSSERVGCSLRDNEPAFVVFCVSCSGHAVQEAYERECEWEKQRERYLKCQD